MACSSLCPISNKQMALKHKANKASPSKSASIFVCLWELVLLILYVCVCVPLPPMWWWFTCRAQHCYAVIKVLIAFAASLSFVMPYNRNYLGLCWNYWAALESVLWFLRSLESVKDESFRKWQTAFTLQIYWIYKCLAELSEFFMNLLREREKESQNSVFHLKCYASCYYKYMHYLSPRLLIDNNRKTEKNTEISTIWTSACLGNELGGYLIKFHSPSI